MALTNNDLEQIKKIVDDSNERSENKIISIISREVSDLSAINRAVIQKIDKVDDLGGRMIQVEKKLSIKA